MDYREITVVWLRGLRWLGLVILGFPSLGWTWLVLVKRFESPKDCWEMHMMEASEDWLGVWRAIGLVVAGFPTLGYTWAILGRVSTIMLYGWRNRIRER